MIEAISESTTSVACSGFKSVVSTSILGYPAKVRERTVCPLGSHQTSPRRKAIFRKGQDLFDLQLVFCSGVVLASGRLHSIAHLYMACKISALHGCDRVLCNARRS